MMGRRIEDVRALVLTHGHSDHVGFAERLRTDRGVPVSVHEADAALAAARCPIPRRASARSGPVRLIEVPLVRPPARCVSAHGTSVRSRRSVTARRLDVPGSPRVILTPGHTPGSAVLHFPSSNGLTVGDAFPRPMP